MACGCVKVVYFTWFELYFVDWTGGYKSGTIGNQLVMKFELHKHNFNYSEKRKYRKHVFLLLLLGECDALFRKWTNPQFFLNSLALWMVFFFGRQNHWCMWQFMVIIYCWSLETHKFPHIKKKQQNGLSNETERNEMKMLLAKKPKNNYSQLQSELNTCLLWAWFSQIFKPHWKATLILFQNTAYISISQFWSFEHCEHNTCVEMKTKPKNKNWRNEWEVTAGKFELQILSSLLLLSLLLLLLLVLYCLSMIII